MARKALHTALNLPDGVELLGFGQGGYHVRCRYCGQEFSNRNKQRLECPHRLFVPPHPLIK